MTSSADLSGASLQRSWLTSSRTRYHRWLNTADTSCWNVARCARIRRLCSLRSLSTYRRRREKSCSFPYLGAPQASVAEGHQEPRLRAPQASRLKLAAKRPIPID